jgi:plasmid stabilization system protein ParE
MAKENKLIVLAVAREDMAEIYRWYEQQGEGVGLRFLAAVDKAFHSIRAFPDSYEIVLADYHRALLKKFPYAVYFEFAEQVVTVHAVLHTSRRQVWLDRIRSRDQ